MAMALVRSGACPKGHCLKGAPTLLANIRLGCNGLQGTNTLAYLASSLKTNKKVL